MIEPLTPKDKDNVIPHPASEEGQAPEKFNKREFLERNLSYLYEFRRNTITQIPEFMNTDTKKRQWQRMNDDMLNSISRKLQLDGIQYATPKKIHEIINSDFSPAYNPIEQYFEDLPKWDKHDYISDLCDTVKTTTGAKLFTRLFKKYLVAMVANVFIKKRCANQLCFILVGNQGTYKSSWLLNLCPPDLDEYYFEGSIDPDNKDSIVRSVENFIINMDDYFADISIQKINALKGFLTKNRVKVRRPYKRFDEICPKICSFMGSTNESQFLYDPTGTRRFLPFKINSIDIVEAQKIKMDLVYSQAYHLFKNNFKYYLTKEDEKILEEHNEEFKIQSLELEMILEYLSKATDIKKATVDFLTTTEIKNYLQAHTRDRIGIKKLGQAMKTIGYNRIFQKKDSQTIWGYYVEKKHTYTQE